MEAHVVQVLVAVLPNVPAGQGAMHFPTLGLPAVESAKLGSEHWRVQVVGAPAVRK